MTQVIVEQIDNIVTEVEINKVEVEVIENNVEINIEINETIIEINNTIKEVTIAVEGIQGATGASNILGESPIFTYNSDKTLSQVLYTSNNAVKSFTYEGEFPKYVDSAISGITTRKQFFFNLDGTLNRIEMVQI